MRKWSQWTSAMGLVVFGYLMGATGVTGVITAWAQNDAADQSTAAQAGNLSEDTQKKVQAVFTALKAAQDALETDSKYISATTGPNAFGILTGGLDALNDLETGRGVDPETFAALYADQATEEVKTKLTRDDQGRLLYNGKLVQMYSISRLKTAFAARNALSGEKAGSAKGTATEKTEAATEETKDE